MSTCRTQVHVAAKVENTVNHFGVVTQLILVPIMPLP